MSVLITVVLRSQPSGLCICLQVLTLIIMCPNERKKYTETIGDKRKESTETVSDKRRESTETVSD